MLKKIGIFLLLLIAIIRPAHAYLDPGTGSILIQGILAALAGLVLTVKLWWHRLLVLLGIRKCRQIQQPDPRQLESDQTEMD